MSSLSKHNFYKTNNKKVLNKLLIQSLFINKNIYKSMLYNNSYQYKTMCARHIVLVTETWFPEINGVSMSLQKLMKCLFEMGHKISLIHPQIRKSLTQRKHIMANNFVTNDIQVKGFPIPKYTDLQIGVPVFSQLKEQFKRINPDIIHIATEGPLGLAALIISKKLNIPVTTGYHTQFHDFSKHFGFGIISKPLMAYIRYMHNQSDATCVPSKKTEKDLLKLGFKRIYKVGRGVDMYHFHPIKRDESLRTQWKAGHQHTVLIMVSRLSPEKGTDLIIKSFDELQRQQLSRDFKLIIVGDGPDKARLQSLSEDNDDIIFTGMQTGNNLAKHYASADVFVFASQVETFGNVVIEAMASGLPVFAFDDAAAGMLVDENSGGLVKVGQENKFCQMIHNLPKLQTLKKQGKVSRTKVSKMSWQKPAEQMLMMFENVISTYHCDKNQL